MGGRKGRSRPKKCLAEIIWNDMYELSLSNLVAFDKTTLNGRTHVAVLK